MGFRDNPGDIVNRSFAQNSAGDLTGLEVEPGQNLTLVGGDIKFEAGRAVARGGNIQLGGLSAAGTVGISDDGFLNFPEDVERADIALINATAVDVRGTGGGSITINARNLNLEAGDFGSSFIGAGITSNSTSVDAQAGDITINATENVTVDGSSSISNQNQVISGTVGNAGGVIINTDNLNLTNGGQVDASTFGQGNAGSVEINAINTIIIDGEDSQGFVSGASTQVIPGAEGDAGGVTITTDSLSLTNGGQVNVNTFGQGNAGAVKITATDTITIDGENSQGFVSGAASQVTPGAEGDAGGVSITTGSLSLTNGGIVDASTGGRGNGGDVTINARESISISGATDLFRTGLFANAFISSGNGGDVKVVTNQLTINDGGGIEAGNFDILGEVAPGTGQPGNINIEANSLSLNRASIEVTTQSEIGEAANINLTIAEDIILRNNSLISATALENADGGNVTINASDGLIIAFPNQNNDIVANADRGNGGNIDITTQAIFGLEERRSVPKNTTNDIDASSEFGLQGSISRNTPEVDPTSGLIELPEAVGDASDQISQNPCEQGVGSEFTITGKGGIPPNPHETLNNDKIRVGLVDPMPSRQGDGEAERQGAEIRVVENNIRPENPTAEAVPAMGWIFNDKGEVTLTSYKTTDTEIKRSPQQMFNSCPAL